MLPAKGKKSNFYLVFAFSNLLCAMVQPIIKSISSPSLSSSLDFDTAPNLIPVHVHFRNKEM